MKLLYEGKAKQLFECENKDEIYIHYKNSATAFNGKKYAEIENKGKLNNEIMTVIFNYLNENGIPTHFIKKVNETDQICKNVKIIPLEVILRNVAAGSFSTKYGVEEKTVLKNSILEFCYKNDDLNDPMLNEDHIQALSLATTDQIEKIKELTYKVNDLLKVFFDKCDLILVDFKLEFGLYNNEVILADEISPDTCRLWDKHTYEKLDKDIFRRELGSLENGYVEVLRRIKNAWN